MKNKSRLLAFILMLVIVAVNNPLLSFANSVIESGKDEVIISPKECLRSEEVPCPLQHSSLVSEGFVNRVYERETSLNQAVFENDDGTFTAYVFNENIKYYDESGELKNKDNNLSLSSDGNYSNINNEIISELPSELSSGVGLEYLDYKIKMTPIYEHLDSTEKLTIDSSKDTGGNRAVYKNAFGVNTILQYTPQYSGLKEDIIITQKIDTNEFSFEITTNGLILVDDETGTYLTLSQSKEHIIDIGEIYINDSGGKYIIGDMMVKELEANQRYILTVIVPEDFMNSTDTIYPITVDPYYTMGEGQSNYLTDTSLFSDYHGNVGAYPTLFVGNTDVWYGSHYCGVARSLVSATALFTQLGYGFQQMCLYNLILSTEVVFFDVEASTANNNIEMYYEDASWDENVTSTPCSAWYWYEYLLDSVEKNSQNCEPVCPKYELDFTHAAYSWANGEMPERGLLLKATDESIESMVIASTEYPDPTKRPYIKFRYVDDITISSGLNVGEEYYIFSTYRGKYLSVANGYDASGTNVCGQSYAVREYYHWIPQHISGTDRTYQLVSANSSTGKVLGSTDYNVNIWTNFDDPVQRFEITRLYTRPYQGLYTIKWGDYYVTEDIDTENIYLTTSFSMGAIWSFIAVDRGDADFFDFSHPVQINTPSQEAFSEVMDQLSYYSYINTNRYATEAYTYLSEYDDIFIFTGDGGPGYLQFRDYNGNATGRLAANDLNNSQSGWCYIDDLADNSLASVRCVLYLGSCTGLDDTSTGTHYSLVDSTFIKGAHFVLGTTDIVFPDDVENFLLGFFWGLSLGCDIQGCIGWGLQGAGDVYLPSSNTYGPFPIVYNGDTYQRVL